MLKMFFRKEEQVATKPSDIRRWLNKGKKCGATHVIVVCDTYDWEDYPVYVAPDENVRKKYAEHNGPNMQKVMEVYSLKIDIEKQLSERRSFHFD